MDVSMLAIGGIRFLWTDAHVSIVASQKVTLRQLDQFGFRDCFFRRFPWENIPSKLNVDKLDG